MSRSKKASTDTLIRKATQNNNSTSTGRGASPQAQRPTDPADPNKTPKPSRASAQTQASNPPRKADWIKLAKRAGTILAVIATLIGIIAKVESIERNREVQIRDQQAVLQVLGPLSFPKPTERWTVALTVVNRGKTTAYKTIGSIFVTIESAGMSEPEPSFDFKGGYPTDIVKDSGTNKSQLFPGMSPDGTLGTPEQQLQNQNEILASVRLGNADAYIFGAATYTTEFGDQGYLEYCYRIQPNLSQIEHCAGNKNRAWVQSKSWMETLLSALPFSSRND